jgi:hypothetical protein
MLALNLIRLDSQWPPFPLVKQVVDGSVRLGGLDQRGDVLGGQVMGKPNDDRQGKGLVYEFLEQAEKHGHMLFLRAILRRSAR